MWGDWVAWKNRRKNRALGLPAAKEWGRERSQQRKTENSQRARKGTRKELGVVSEQLLNELGISVFKAGYQNEPLPVKS